nr:hypothetical protein [Aliamphritea spongicola]
MSAFGCTEVNLISGVYAFIQDVISYRDVKCPADILSQQPGMIIFPLQQFLRMHWNGHQTVRVGYKADCFQSKLIKCGQIIGTVAEFSRWDHCVNRKGVFESAVYLVKIRFFAGMPGSNYLQNLAEARIARTALQARANPLGRLCILVIGQNV